MNLIEHFEKISQFIESWKDFLDFEPIRKYPDYCPQKIEPWVEELSQKNLEELVEFENNLKIKTSIKGFQETLDSINEFIDFPIFTSIEASTELVSNKLKNKKQHEIKQIKTLLDKLDGVDLIDIGSGTGHLSENLVHDKNRFSYCIDQNQELQLSGKKRIAENNQQNLTKIEFHTECFSDQSKLNLKKIFDDRLILGLHACGDLTSDILKFYHDSKADHLLSLGCCYHKLTTKYNLSKQAKKRNIKFTTNTFNLAARSYSFQTKENLQNKIQIRTYRYMLHIYLYSLGHKDFIPTGQTKLSDYRGSFEEYADKYAKDHIDSSSDAQIFFDTPENQETVKKIIYTDIFRGIFGRVIESYIVLDRALFLQEQGHDVFVQEIFDRKLSPRNLAIISKPKYRSQRDK